MTARAWEGPRAAMAALRRAPLVRRASRVRAARRMEAATAERRAPADGMEHQPEASGVILTRNVVALAAVAMWSILAWHSLIALVARGRGYLSAQGARHDMLPALVWLAVSCAAAVYVIRETGLLALVRRPPVAQATRSDWWRWLAHFKLSLAALSLTCVAAWLARVELLRWLV